jgi:histidine ammonia-lyase
VYAPSAAADAAAMLLAPPAALGLEALGRIADGAPVALGDGVRERLEASHRQLLALARSGRVVYGLNTGCGPLCERPVPPEARTSSSGTSCAATRPASARRTAAGWCARPWQCALSLAQGRSAVRPVVVDTLVAMLNACVHPVVPEIGSVGAKRPRRARAHGARAHGGGRGRVAGARRPAAEALTAARIAPVAPRDARRSALMNGTSCETAQAALLVLDAEALVAAAEAAAALVIEVLGGSAEAFDERVHAVRPHADRRARRRGSAASRREQAPPAGPRAGAGASRRASAGAGRLHAPLRPAGARRGARDRRPRARRHRDRGERGHRQPTFLAERTRSSTPATSTGSRSRSPSTT